MHALFVGFLTVVLVLDCILLVLLVLLQLPKKEAGAGLAFGGAATDALFGAGSGNVLTRITKYVAAVFFVLALLLAVVGKPPVKATLADKLSAVPAATAPVSQTKTQPLDSGKTPTPSVPVSQPATAPTKSTNK